MNIIPSGNSFENTYFYYYIILHYFNVYYHLFTLCLLDIWLVSACSIKTRMWQEFCLSFRVFLCRKLLEVK